MISYIIIGRLEEQSLQTSKRTKKNAEISAWTGASDLLKEMKAFGLAHDVTEGSEQGIEHIWTDLSGKMKVLREILRGISESDKEAKVVIAAYYTENVVYIRMICQNELK